MMGPVMVLLPQLVPKDTAETLLMIIIVCYDVNISLDANSPFDLCGL